MSGHKHFDELQKKIDADPERRARIEYYMRQLDQMVALHAWFVEQGCTEEEAARGMGPILSFTMGIEEEEAATGNDVPRIAKLVDDWLHDESGYDEETWPELKEYLQRIGKM